MKAWSFLVSAGGAAGLALGVLATMQGCVLPTFEVGTPPSDGGANVVVVEAGSGACGKSYPDPPAGADDPLNQEVVVAIHSIDLGEGSTSPPGYDLDRQCSCINDAGPTCVSILQQCDAPDGVDNSVSRLMNLLSLALGGASFGSSYFSTKANDGAWTLLIRVRGYNGLPDDPSVDVALFPSQGMDGGPAPTWDGADAWPVMATSVVQGNLEAPVYHAAGAYVSGGVLVAALPSAAITFAGSSERLSMIISGGVLTGKLQAFGSTFRIREGVIAGRWAEHDAFLSLSSYRDGFGKPICTDSLIGYGNLKGAVCKGRDILKDASGAKSLPCDALSMGLGFDADPALLGAVKAPVAPTPGCDPPDTDPANDSCAP